MIKNVELFLILVFKYFAIFDAALSANKNYIKINQKLHAEIIRTDMNSNNFFGL